MSYFKVNDQCNGCLACVQNCPANALDYMDHGGKRKILHNMTLCARCGNCWRVCPRKAVEFQSILHGQWEEVVTMELVTCRVCGAPLHTVPLGQSLAEKLAQDVDPLCPRHRKDHPFMVWKRLFSDNGKTKEIGL